jgi:hypothetical protein
VDNDGIPDFADGYNLYGGTSATLEGVNFVPYILDLRGIEFADDARIRFYYSASHPWLDTSNTPGGVVRTGTGTPEDPFVYTPGPGNFRLWTTDNWGRTNSEPLRDGGQYVAPVVWY